MKSHRKNRKAILEPVSTVIAAVLIAGCATAAAASIRASEPVAATKAERVANKSIASAEKQAAKQPQAAAVRANLAHAYLTAGRFESAATTFEDARYLGDTSARTVLGLALSYIGAGNGAEAVATLDGARDLIPVSDYGLALALAGETGRGVEVLADALRGGENTVKLRQNLAYAYALDGRWREARLMASQDVPADRLDARISDWARQGKPEDFRVRVASILGAPLRADQGRPTHLALVRDPSTEIATLPVPSLAARQPVPGNDRELPPIDNGESFWVAEATRPEPVPAPLAPVPAHHEMAAVPPKPQSAQVSGSASAFDAAFHSPVAPDAAPLAKAAPQRVAASDQPVRKTRQVAAKTNIFPGVKAAANGSHLVQLGSFSSRANAERAWSIFVSRNPELASFDRTLSEAVVGGRKFWRVSAGGLDRNSSRQMCATVKNRGGECIAWAAGNPLPGAIRKD